MWHWRKENFEGLQQISEYLAGKEPLSKFKEYCEYREKGLRKEAFAKLNEFIDGALDWKFNDKKEFSDWVLWVNNGSPEIIDLIPQPLKARFIEPVLKEWKEIEPNNSAPFRWSGGLEDLRKAIQLNQDDQIARIKLAEIILTATNYSIHELPNGYLGDANDDLDLVLEALKVIENIKNNDKNISIWAELSENYKIITEFILNKNAS